MAKLFPKELPKHFWTTESGLTGMLVLLCLSNFVVFPFFSHTMLISILIRVFWMLLLFAGITTLSRSRSQIWVLSLIPALFILVSAIQYLVKSEILEYVDFITEIAVFSLLTGLVLVRVFEKGAVSIHRVVGAIVVYMLIGNIWAIIYQFLYAQIPGSIHIPGTALSTEPTPSVFLYFSFTTLTTTGYGDILPVHSVARTVAIIEQLIGVLYPAVLIGRLVSLVVVSKDDKTDAAE